MKKYSFFLFLLNFVYLILCNERTNEKIKLDQVQIVSEKKLFFLFLISLRFWIFRYLDMEKELLMIENYFL